MTAEGSAAEQLDAFKESRKMAEINECILLAAAKDATFVFIVNEKLGTIREGIFIATILRIYQKYEVTFHREGILVKL